MDCEVVCLGPWPSHPQYPYHPFPWSAYRSLYSEVGGSRLFRNVGSDVPDYTKSRQRQEQSWQRDTCSLTWGRQLPSVPSADGHVSIWISFPSWHSVRIQCSRLLPCDRHSGVKECCCGKLSVCNLTRLGEYSCLLHTSLIWIGVGFSFMMVTSSLIHCQGARSQEIALCLNPLNPVKVAGVLCLACGRQALVIAAVQQTCLSPGVTLQCTLASKVLYRGTR
jgi:hypothetical protein